MPGTAASAARRQGCSRREPSAPSEKYTANGDVAAFYNDVRRLRSTSPIGLLTMQTFQQFHAGEEAGQRVCYSAGPFPLVPALNEILPCLKKYGQRLDSELAKETGVPIAKVRAASRRIVRDGRHHHLQPDPLRARQTNRRVAVSHVGLGSTSSARSKSEAAGVVRGCDPRVRCVRRRTTLPGRSGL